MLGKVLAVGLMCLGAAAGQDTHAPTVATTAATATSAPAKTYTFEVVSIRQNNSEQRNGPLQFGPTPSGYRMTNMPMILPLLTAYVPQAGNTGFYAESQVKGYPEWSDRERYDIDARISDEDREAWQNPVIQKAMLQSMLQTMFKERCKLAVHREVKELSIYTLVVAKGGIKFKEADLTVEHPGGVALPWGGVMVRTGDTMTLYGVTSASLATMLSQIAHLGRPIEDHTGLAAKYDVMIKPSGSSASAGNEPKGVATASDPGSAIYSVLNDLGLKLESTKGQVETLVIDHMERPSEN